MKDEMRSIMTSVIPVMKAHDVRSSALFGSYARGDADAKSDVDILVDLPEDKTLLDLVDIKFDLEEKLGRKVDVVTYNSLPPLLRKRILKERIQIPFE